MVRAPGAVPSWTLFTEKTRTGRVRVVKATGVSPDADQVKRLLAILAGLICAAVAAVPALGLSLPPISINNPGYAWAAAPLNDLVAHHGWPTSDTASLGRIATRRELARGLAELLRARGKTPPAHLVRPSDIAASDADLQAIEWVSTSGLLGTPGGAFSPNAQVTTRGAELAIVEIFGLTSQLNALSSLHTSNGTRLPIPTGFAEDVIASDLGVRHDYPSSYDYLETSTGATMPMAELAGMVDAAVNVPAWKLAYVANLSSIVLPNLTANQRTAIDAALAAVGSPYVWGGVTPNVQSLFGATTAGGFDCSGLVWWVYKLSSASAAAGLGRDIVGRTADAMAWENPSQKLAISQVQAGDLVFFGPEGPRTPRGQIQHVVIALGNGWMIHANTTTGGVSIEHLTGWWDAALAWVRRPAGMGAVAAPTTAHPSNTARPQMNRTRWIMLLRFIHSHYRSGLWSAVWHRFTSRPPAAYALLARRHLV
jgi:cell wall-associated NlpC family hydrolase